MSISSHFISFIIFFQSVPSFCDVEEKYIAFGFGCGLKEKFGVSEIQECIDLTKKKFAENFSFCTIEDVKCDKPKKILISEGRIMEEVSGCQVFSANCKTLDREKDCKEGFKIISKTPSKYCRNLPDSDDYYECVKPKGIKLQKLNDPKTKDAINFEKFMSLGCMSSDIQLNDQCSNLKNQVEFFREPINRICFKKRMPSFGPNGNEVKKINPGITR